ncbi:NAC domain-containing protein 17, partial [Cucurbita argyrosperma subsp. sororia]
MTPSTGTSPATLDLFVTEKEVCRVLRRISNGDPLPENVLVGIDPYQCKPENLPDGVWFYGKCDGNSNSSWRRKGGDIKLYSDSFFTGWRATYEYYEGQAPHEHKTAWVLHEYWTTDSGTSGNSKQRETSSLYKLFVGDEQFQSPEKIQKIELSTVPNSESINQNHQLVVPDGSNNMADGSTNQPEMREVIRSDMDYISRGDFLEIQDLDTPASSSSSSENSSRVSFTSDEYFDPMALLRDIDRDNNFDTVRRDAACIRSSAPIRLRTEVVHQGGSESLVDTNGSHLPGKESPKPESVVPGSGCKEPKLLKGEASSNCQNKVVAKGKEAAAAMDGGKKKKKKKSISRMKKIQKKYFCFFFSF